MEVNISSKTREIFMSSLAQWSENDALLMSSSAKYAIDSDPKKRGEVFEASLREIKIMLYQVLPMFSINQPMSKTNPYSRPIHVQDKPLYFILWSYITLFTLSPFRTNNNDYN